MPEIDEPDDSAGRQPLPPDDRLWRHPSELRAAPPTAADKPPSRRGTGRQHGFGFALVGGAVAAVAVVVTLDTTGAMRDRDVATVELATVTTSSAVPTLGAVRRIVPDIAGVVWISAGDTQSPTPGIVIDDHGHVLTSASSMATATPTAVECAGEDTQNVRIVGVDRRRNIAVIATDKRNWPTAAVNTVRLAVGERIQLLFHDGNRSTPELLSAEVRRLDTDGGPVISWSGSVGSSAIAVSRGGAVVALLDGTAGGDGIGITEALKSARAIIARSDATSTTTQR
ncbi:MAG: hypothetical protein V9G12_24705 [Microthrixaceae bacterium]